MGLYFQEALLPSTRSRIANLTTKIVGWAHPDMIAVRGVSGMVIGAIVAERLGANLIVIRKPGESTHSSYPYAGEFVGNSYVIIDDFIDTGDTVKQILAVMQHESDRRVVKGNLPLSCMGFVGYGESWTVRSRPARQRQCQAAGVKCLINEYENVMFESREND
jgi:hypothetical protein